MNTREEGYYWCKKHGGWKVYKWQEDSEQGWCWDSFGNEKYFYEDSDFEEINENELSPVSLEKPKYDFKETIEKIKLPVGVKSDGGGGRCVYDSNGLFICLEGNSRLADFIAESINKAHSAPRN